MAERLFEESFAVFHLLIVNQFVDKNCEKHNLKNRIFCRYLKFSVVNRKLKRKVNASLNKMLSYFHENWHFMNFKTKICFSLLFEYFMENLLRVNQNCKWICFSSCKLWWIYLIFLIYQYLMNVLTKLKLERIHLYSGFYYSKTQM